MSQCFTVEKLMRDLLKKLCKEERKEPPHDISEMDRDSLIDEARNLFCKRGVLLYLMMCGV